uniref:Uncharacterized protein n=1 Tax=Arundo donax TaxID=35708 RepID=A0A0A9C1T5_ARUDO
MPSSARFSPSGSAPQSGALTLAQALGGLRKTFSLGISTRNGTGKYCWMYGPRRRFTQGCQLLLCASSGLHS